MKIEKLIMRMVIHNLLLPSHTYVRMYLHELLVSNLGSNYKPQYLITQYVHTYAYRRYSIVKTNLAKQIEFKLHS